MTKRDVASDRGKAANKSVQTDDVRTHGVKTERGEGGRVQVDRGISIAAYMVSVRRIWTKLGILPTSLPELPIKLKDLRNKEKSLKAYFIFSLSLILKVWTWISVSRPLEPDLGRKFHVYFEF